MRNLMISGLLAIAAFNSPSAVAEEDWVAKSNEHAQVVLDGRTDRDLVTGARLVCVHRHEVHAHRRFPGFVAPEVRVNRRNLVQDFPFSTFAGRDGDALICVILRILHSTARQPRPDQQTCAKGGEHDQDPDRPRSRRALSA